MDVAIVGGGPAGTAAALTLLRYSALRVAVIERSDYQQVRVGETIPPSLQPLLEYLGVWQRFVADAHCPSYGTAAIWGSPTLMTRDFLFTGRGDGWHLDRGRFDRMLADEVLARGGVLLTETRVAECARDAAGQWQLDLQHASGSSCTLSAKFVLDASGRSAAVARRQGAQRAVYDRLVGVIGFYTSTADTPRVQSTLVEAVEDGWWYSALLPDRRLVVALMSDADLVQQQRAQLPTIWQARLAATTATSARLADARLAGPLVVRPAHSQQLQPAVGPGWIAAGDAAAAFDPLASMGIGHAIASGTHAARVAHDLLTSDGSLLPGYAASMARNVQQYLELRRQYYCLERRWSDQPFWMRRHQLRQPSANVEREHSGRRELAELPA